LLEVVGTAHTPGGLAGILDGGQQQSDEEAMMAMTLNSSISVKPRR
jgi:hypothetical protein